MNKAFCIGYALGLADGLIKAFDESKVKRDGDGKFAEKPMSAYDQKKMAGERHDAHIVGAYAGGMTAGGAAASVLLNGKSASSRTMKIGGARYNAINIYGAGKVGAIVDAIDGAILGVKAGADRVMGNGKAIPKPGGARVTKAPSRNVFARAIAGAKVGVAAGKDIDKRVAAAMLEGKAGANFTRVARQLRATKLVRLPVLAGAIAVGATAGAVVAGKFSDAVYRSRVAANEKYGLKR